MKAKARAYRRAATLREVAAVAGVSPMTVSNVVNRKFEFMSEKTRRRVDKAIARLNYRPHSAGRSLRLAQRLSIGMIIVDESPAYLADPFITYVVAGLSNFLSERGYGLFLQGLTPGKFENSTLIQSIQTDGLCVLLSGNRAKRKLFLDILVSLSQPIVAFQERIALPGRDLCAIRQNDREGGRLLAQHLLANGARRLLMLVPALEWPAIAARVRGVRKAISGSGAGARLDVIPCGDCGFRDTHEALDRYLEVKELPEAILAGNDQMGIAAMKFLAARRVRVPHDLLLTGFNAFDFWQFTEPVLTTVRSPAYEMGARGGEEILKRLETGRFERKDIVIPVSLQQGGST